MKSPRSEMVCFAGFPGSGKSSLIALMASDLRAAGYKVYTSGIAVKGIPEYDLSLVDQNIWPAAGCILLIDESGLDLNNQRTLSDRERQFFKLYRHNKDEYREMTIIYFSQNLEDTNIVLRRLTVAYFWLKKVGSFTLSFPILTKLCIKPFVPNAGLFDSNRGYGDMQIGYKVGSVFSSGFKLFYRPRAYSLFNSHVLPKGVKILEYEEASED